MAAEAHRYRITPINPGAHLFQVKLDIADPDPAGQLVSIPAWIPGSYLVRDFARNVVSIKAQAGDRDVELTKIDKSSWQADACHEALTITCEIFAYDLSVRGAHCDTTHAYFNGACVFPQVVGQEERACEVEICPPPRPLGNDWRVATSMRPRNAERYGFGNYHADNYDELIDHPVEIGNLLIGEFEAGGIPHAIAVRGHTRIDMARVCHDLATLCEQHLALLGAPKDLDRYLFLLLVLPDGYGGLEHRWSSSLVCGRGDLPVRGESGTKSGYRKFLRLCSHEYFHLWNVKRMKPGRFTPYDLRAESHTCLLWVFEGITSYYDSYQLMRSGLITRESYLELLAKTITRVLRTRGRFRQSVEESSFDAWTKFYRPDANTSNAVISYYTKGSLIALALDLTIRRDTDAKESLDTVMRECWKRFGETGEGMPEMGFESIAASVSGLDLREFFERYVRGTGDLPLQKMLKDFGVIMRLRAADGTDDAGGKPSTADTAPAPWLGMNVGAKSGKDLVTMVHTDSPAERAGIAPGDELIALNDVRLTAANIDTRLREYHAGDKVSLSVFRNDGLLKFKVRLGDPPEDTCYLEIDGERSAKAEQALAAWLSQP
ncbi:MAG: PDZ domain-containing protein [Woeseia sp.]